MKRTIHLHGAFENATGIKTLKLDVDTPRMMILGLNALVPEFETALRGLDVPINIISANKRTKNKSLKGYSPHGLSDDFGKATDIHIIPAVEGAGTEIVAYFALAAAGSGAAIAYAIVINIAISLVVGAIASSMASKPDTSAGSQRPDQKQSFIFNGPVNVQSQGASVPLVYGTCLTGSIVISSGYDSVEIS